MYEINICKTNLEFKEAYKSYLDVYEPHMQLFFRNLIDENRLLSDNEIRGAVYHDNKPVALFLNAYPFNLQLLILDYNHLESVNVLIKHIIDHKINIRGVQGNLKDCKVFMEYYEILTNKKLEITYSMDILCLYDLIEVPCNGKLHLANHRHVDLLVNNLIEFHKEALNENVEYEMAKQTIENMIENKCLYVYENENNEITSCVQKHKSLPLGCGVSFVYTLKEHRGKGYAKSMMYLLCKEILKESKYATLFVDKLNPISNKVYEDVGFKVVTDNYDCRII